MRNYFIFAMSLVVLLFSPVSKADELSDLKKKVDQQQKEINQLRQDLERLEHGMEPDESTGIKPIFGANLGIFGDINFSTNSREKSRNSFYLGDMDLYSTGNYGDRLTFLTELVVENEKHGFKFDIERLWAGYTFSDFLIIRAGKQHIALGYWNKTYHHGRHLFTTVDRPFFLKFEHDGGVVPTHIIGIEMEGSKTTQSTRFKYELEIGNGPRIDHSDMMLNSNALSDDNDSKQVALRLSMRPNNIPDFVFGVFGTTYTIETMRKADLEEHIFGIDISYTKLPWELITEYFGFHNSVGTANAYYAQLAYSLDNSITPYIRYERLDVDENDPYFLDLTGGSDRSQSIIGVKYDIEIIHSSIKAQYRYDDKKGDKTYNVFEMQWAFHF